MKVLRVGLVAGEASGDILGAAFMSALKALHPAVHFEGILGTRMLQQGGFSYYPLERLSVMGFIEPLKRLPELILMRRALYRHFIENKIDVFIGIDAPAFTLGLEARLKKAGIKTVHYVSPSVWAWRKGRIHKIARAVDMMLTLFPFENKIYEEHHIPHFFVGHPLADAIPRTLDKKAAVAALGFSGEHRLIALMPGSRMSELQHLGEVFFETAKLCYAAHHEVHFLLPVIQESHQRFLEAIQKRVAPALPITFYIGKSREVLTAADVVLVASGTATLEAMLVKCPMVVAYRMSAITYRIAKWLVKTPFIALPNILAGRALVPEFIQERATKETLSAAVLAILDNEDNTPLLAEFDRLHASLQCSASERAAACVLNIITLGVRHHA